MKKKLLLFGLLFQSILSFSQIKIKDLPTTTTGSTSDWLLKDDVAGVSGSTKKITVADFISTYSLGGSGTYTVTNAGTNLTITAGTPTVNPTLSVISSPTFISPIIDGLISVTKPTGLQTYYKPSANTDAARGAALATAFSAMSAGDAIMIGAGSYSVTASLVILASTSVVGRGALLYTNDKALSILTATSVNDWRVDGVTLQGAGNASSPTDYGIKIDMCTRFTISNVNITNVKNIALAFLNTGVANIGWTGGRFSNIIIQSCGIGIKTGYAAEYNSFSNISVDGSTTGAQLEGANNHFAACHFVNNAYGLKDLTSANSGHNVFVGCSFNHNTIDNIYSNALQPSTFSGCDIYANDGTSGFIEIEGTGAVRIIGGVLASPIVATGTLSNISDFTSTRTPTAFTVGITATTANQAFLRFLNCTKDNGTLVGYTGWVDYSATSTIVGFSSFINKILLYKVTNGVLEVQFDLYGASSLSTVSFTIPFPIKSDAGNIAGACRIFDNGAYKAALGFWISNTSSSTINFGLDGSAIGGFTSSGNKAVQGILRVPIN